MKVAILGSGFGLYGYLPAIARGCGEQVILPERYHSQLCERSDVGHLADEIEWCPNEAEVLERSNAVVVTQRPSDQVHWIADFVSRSNLQRILLEKPIAPTPDAAAHVLDELSRHRRTVRVGYTFRYTTWGKLLLSSGRAGGAPAPIEIDWSFRAHHYRNGLQNWKRSVSSGGGVVRFFGIHVIALLAEMGYRFVSMSEVAAGSSDEAERWRAIFSGSDLPEARIRIDSNADSELFRVNAGDLSVHLRDPFEEATTDDGFDRRVDGLTELCRDFLYGSEGCPSWYRASVELWSQAESVAEHTARKSGTPD